jgi:Flp pilus assembly protein TadG
VRRLRGSRRGTANERGAVAVELLVIFPVLFAIFVGIVEFGAIFNAQITLTQATREGVRVGAIGPNRTVANMQTRMQAAYGGVGAATPTAVTAQSNACTGDLNSGSARLTTQLAYETPFGIVGPFTLRARAEMRCGG